jgi:hypothetical protein
VQWLADNRSEDPMEVERRKVSQLRQLGDRQRLWEVILDMVNDSVDSAAVDVS